MKKIYKNYPGWIVLAAFVSMALSWVTGLYILFSLHLIAGVLYAVFLLMLEISIYRDGCRHCCYYGRTCAHGRGRIVPLFMKKGDPKKFNEKSVSFKSFLPYLLGNLIPLVIGIVLLISRGFNWLILIAALYPVLAWFVVNPLLFGQLACPHCEQCSKCPAAQYFMKKEKDKLKKKK